MASPNKKAYLLRSDPELFDAIQRWADDEFRSINQQIEYLLREALRRAGRKPASPRAARRTSKDEVFDGTSVVDPLPTDGPASPTKPNDG